MRLCCQVQELSRTFPLSSLVSLTFETITHVLALIAHTGL